MPIQLFQSAFCFKGSGEAGRSGGGGKKELSGSELRSYADANINKKNFSVGTFKSQGNEVNLIHEKGSLFLRINNGERVKIITQEMRRDPHLLVTGNEAQKLPMSMLKKAKGQKVRINAPKDIIQKANFLSEDYFNRKYGKGGSY
jgi:hypothetical protein